MRLIIIVILSFFASSILLAQGELELQEKKTTVLKSYAFTQVISDTNFIPLEIQEITQITGWDIGGQLALSLLSGTIFAIGGALIGDLLSSGSSDIPPETFYGLLIGYSIGVPIGVYVAASNKKYDSNLLDLIGSSIVGEIAGIYLAYRFNDLSDEWLLATLVLPPIFTIVSLNVFQQKKSNIKIGFDVQQLPQPNAYSYGVKLQYEF